jgi:hypothetical protein
LDDADFIVEEGGGWFYLENVDDDANNDVHGGQQLGIIPTDEEYPCPDVNDVETFKCYLNAEFIVHRGDEASQARVVKGARADTGALIGKSHDNPLFDTREYECI